MMYSLSAEKARTLLTKSEELLVALRINKSASVYHVLNLAKKAGYLQEICTSNIEVREIWLDAVRDQNDYPLLLKLGREKKIPIIEAIKLSRDEYVQKMLEFGVDINVRIKRVQSTPLETALRSNNLELMKVLIEKYNADPNIRDPLWQTPIYAALEMRNSIALRYLLEKGADPNNIDSFGITPLSFILGDKQLRLLDKDILDILLEYGADCNKKQAKGELVPLHVVLSNKFAPANVKVMAVEMLLERRADPDATDSEKRVPLLYICSDLCDTVQKSRCDIVNLLLKYGADPNLLDECYNTPLHTAAKCDLAKVVEVLTENGANPKLRNVDGLRPIDLANKGSGVEMVLLEAMEKWQDTDSDSKAKKDETDNPNSEAGNTTFKEIASYLQLASDRFRSSINRVNDAIEQIEIIKQPSFKPLETIDESYDEVDGKVQSEPFVDDDSKILTTKDSIEHIKLEFFKLKSFAYSFQRDYQQVVKELKRHRNCKATFEIPPDFEIKEAGGMPPSYFDHTTELPKPSEDERILGRACHVTSTLLGHDWKTLFRELMNDDLICTEVIIKELEVKYPGQLREQAYQALLYWKSKSGGSVCYSNLVDAVSACSLGAVQQRLDQVFGSDKTQL